MKKKIHEESIRNKVYEYRVLARLSQQELADRVGVSKQTIFVMEKGNYVPSLLLSFRISNFLNVPLTEIFEYDLGGQNNDE